MHCSIWTSWMSSSQHRNRWIESILFKEHLIHSEGILFSEWPTWEVFWLNGHINGLGTWILYFVLVIFLFWVQDPMKIWWLTRKMCTYIQFLPVVSWYLCNPFYAILRPLAKNSWFYSMLHALPQFLSLSFKGGLIKIWNFYSADNWNVQMNITNMFSLLIRLKKKLS